MKSAARDTDRRLTSLYRPRRWEQFIGQPDLVKAMTGMLQSGNVDPAFLLSGPRGVGKSSAARVLATYLNCTGRDDIAAPPCGKCDVCVGMAQSPPSHPDYHEINAAEQRGIDDVRAETDRVRFRPQTRYRVIVFDEAHQLTSAAQPALLKPLEEPPQRVVFILCTTARLRVDEALRSRCVDLPLKPVAPEETAGLLRHVCDKEKIDLDDKTLLRISRAVDGYPRDALKALSKVVATIAAGGKFDAASIKQSVQQAVADSPAKVCQEYLRSLLNGEMAEAFLALDRTDSHAYTIEQSLQLLERSIRFLVGLDDHQLSSAWLAILQNELMVDEAKDPVARATVVFNELCRVATEARRYTIDARYLAQQAALNLRL